MIMSQIIFISHRTTDKDIAELLRDYFVSLGVNREYIFCSSLPGNDVNQKISEEVKEAIKNSCLNIAILSKAYYESAYCLNEAGIIWFSETQVILIAKSEITPNNMIGFLNNEYKIRRLNNEDDIAFICDKVCELTNTHVPKISVITSTNRKLKDDYESLESNPISLNDSSFKVEMNNDSAIHTSDQLEQNRLSLLKSIEKLSAPDYILDIAPKMKAPNNDTISLSELRILFNDNEEIVSVYQKLLKYISEIDSSINDLIHFHSLYRESDGCGGFNNEVWDKIIEYESRLSLPNSSNELENEFQEYCDKHTYIEHIPEINEDFQYNYYTITHSIAMTQSLFDKSKKELIELMIHYIKC